MTAAIEFRAVSRIYGDVRAVDDVSFSVEPGEFFAMLGPSGSGKTTCLRLVAGFEAPDRGHVLLDGQDVTDVPPYERNVNTVFQDYALFPHMTALGNIHAALGHRPSGERRGRARELLAAVQLADKADRLPGALSGGERQRVALARALGRDPDVLLLDEPFSAVDRAVRRQLQNLVDTLRQSLDVPIVLVTHDFTDIVRLASHLLLLERGRVVASGSVRELTARPDLPWLGEAAGAGAVIDADVVRIDPARGLAELAFDGGVFVAASASLAAGQRVRVRVPARDVILATDPSGGLSLHNVLAATVATITADASRRQAIVQLGIGREHLLAEVTDDAVQRLALEPGRSIYALIKSVSLDVLPRA